jgi:putative peptidoglycan lipid II flippase
MTLISRILGFVRDMLIARIFGVDLATDAFFVAFKIPNFFRRLFAEGAFAHAFVPVLSEYKQQENLKQFVDKTFGTLGLVLLLANIICIIVAPLLVLILAPGFAWQGEQHDLSVLSLQIMLPYLSFIVLVAFSGGILNAKGRFAIPALTPMFLNITMIVTAIWLSPILDVPVLALAWGVLIAGLVQLLFQLPSLMHLGLLPRLRVDFRDPGVKRVINMMLPAVFSVSVTQINFLLDTLFASFLKIGSVSWLYYSDRLVEFPLGILGLGLGTAILPNLANSHASNNPAAFSNALDWGLRLTLLVGLPSTLGLILLAEPILSTLFQYREFSVSDVYFAGQSVKAYATGLLGYIVIKVLVSGFSARQDMKTPVRYGVYAMLASMLLNVVLVFPLAHAGLALATSLGAFINAGLLLHKLFKDRIYQPASGWWLFSTRIMMATVCMSLLLYFLVDASLWNHWKFADRAFNLLKAIIAGSGIYLLVLMLTGLKIQHFMGAGIKQP